MNTQADGGLAQQLYQQIAEYAPTPGSQQRCLRLRPQSDPHQLKTLHRQSREMQDFLQNNQPFEHPHLPKKNDWLKLLLKTPASSLRPLKAYLQIAEAFRHALQLQQTRYPALWQLTSALKPEQAWLKPILKEKQLTPESQKQLRRHQAWLENLVQGVDELGVVLARVAYTPGGELPQISFKREFVLQAWLPERLNRIPPIDLKFDEPQRVCLLQGAHGVGKTRLMQSVYLACLQHQLGVPFRCGQNSRLPVFRELHYLGAEQSLPERLQSLKPHLHQKESFHLLLVDHFLCQSSPGESHVVAKALLKQLAEAQAFNLVISYDPLLLQLAVPGSALSQLSLLRQGQRKQSPLAFSIDTAARPDLLKYLRQQAWPHALIQDAEAALKNLKKTPAKPVASPPKVQVQAVKKARQKQTQLTSSHPVLPPHAPLGSWVFVPRLNLYGELASQPDREQRVKVVSEQMTLKIPVSDLVLSSHRKARRGDTSGVRIQTFSHGAEACDLHGLTVDEALPLMEKFLDTAFHSGLLQVRIVHGKGTSTLRAAVHRRLDELRSESDYIRHFRLGFPGEGDSGVTVVELHGQSA